MGRSRYSHPNKQNSRPFSTADVSAPAANTAAVVTYAAVTSSSGTAGVMNQPVPTGYINPANNPQNTSHVIEGFVATVAANAAAAFSAVPYVTVEDGSGNVVFKAHLNLESEGASSHVNYVLDFRFPGPMRGTAGRAMIVTLPAVGANTQGILTVLGHHTELA